VVWLSRLLRKVSKKVTTYFAAGNSDEKDVAYWSLDSVPDAMVPLARVFEGIKANQLVYRHNRLGKLDGPTTKEALTEALEEKLSAVPAGGEVFLIYNGHGGLDWPDAKENYLRLWGRGKLTVSELDKLLDRAPPNATIRFILPQCFSGAFHRLVYEKPGELKLTEQKRCGFLAQSAYRESEGCSLNINKASFRDYTTYYFAPLNGKTRNEEPLPSNPDLNGDGRLSYREGHLYMLRNAESKDLSRSTSESFLEDWQPWYLRWDSWTENPKSLYWGLAETVAKRNGLPLDGPGLRAKHKAMRGELNKIKTTRNALKKKIKKTQRAIRSRLRNRWPELLHPYTEGYRKLLQNDLATATRFIEKDAEYAALSRDQDTLIDVQQEKLAMERRMAQVEKVMRFKKLARLEAQFGRFASEAEKESYRRLLSCEEGDFAPVGKP
jgi:hypothetical protein